MTEAPALDPARSVRRPERTPAERLMTKTGVTREDFLAAPNR